MKKYLLYISTHPKITISMYLLSIILCAFLFSIFESRPFADGIWWSFITSLTIGYGDISPITLEGRILGITFGHFWIFFIIPMIVVNIVGALIEDKDRFSHEEQEWMKKMIQKIAEKEGIKNIPKIPKSR